MPEKGPIYRMVEEKSKQGTMGDDLCVGRSLAFDEILPEIEKLEPVWIPVGERLPEKGVNVLTFNKNGYFCIRRLDTDCWSSPGVDVSMYFITHWQPLNDLQLELTRLIYDYLGFNDCGIMCSYFVCAEKTKVRNIPDNQDTEIIGHPPILSDCMKALYKRLEQFDRYEQTQNCDRLLESFPYDWNYELPYLKDQSEELGQKLISLL